MEVKELIERVEQVSKALTDQYAKAEADVKAAGEVAAETKAAIAAMQAEFVDLKVKLDKSTVAGGTAMPQTRRVDIGHAFVESKEFKDAVAGGRRESAPFSVKELVSSDAASAGDLIVPQRIPGVIAEPDRKLTLRDLLPSSPAASGIVEYVRETMFTNAAAVAAESVQGTVVTKAESTLRFDLEQVTIKTIAHWIPASRQILRDAPLLAGYINTRLVTGLMLAEEDYILDEILDDASTYDDTLVTTLGVTDATRIDHIRAAILQARLAEYPVTGVVLNPTDWAAIELAKGSDDRYVWVSVPDGGVPRLWRVPVVETTAIDAGRFLVGAFNMGAAIWDREAPTVRYGEQHSTYFTSNMVAILAEEAIAVPIYRPQAFVSGLFAGYGS